MYGCHGEMLPWDASCSKCAIKTCITQSPDLRQEILTKSVPERLTCSGDRACECCLRFSAKIRFLLALLVLIKAFSGTCRSKAPARGGSLQFTASREPPAVMQCVSYAHTGTCGNVFGGTNASPAFFDVSSLYAMCNDATLE